MTAPLSQKGTARKEEIIQTAAEIFSRKGVSGTSVNDIVAQMHIAKGSFYHYFESKDALVELLISKQIEEYIFEIEQIVADSSMAFCLRLRRFLDRIYEITSLAPDLREFLQQYVIDEFVLKAADILADFMEEGVRLGEVHSSQTKTATLITCLGMEALWRNRRKNGRYSAVGLESFSELLATVEDIFHMEPGCLESAE